MQEMLDTCAWSLGRRRASGEGNGNTLQYSCLENSISMGSQRVGQDWAQRIGEDNIFWVSTIIHISGLELGALHGILLSLTLRLGKLGILNRPRLLWKYVKVWQIQFHCLHFPRHNVSPVGQCHPWAMESFDICKVNFSIRKMGFAHNRNIFSLGGNAERTFLLDLLLKRNFKCPDQPISEWCIPADQTWLTYLRPKLAELEKERWLFGKFWDAPAWFSLQESWGISTWILPPGFGFCL